MEGRENRPVFDRLLPPKYLEMWKYSNLDRPTAANSDCFVSCAIFIREVGQLVMMLLDKLLLRVISSPALKRSTLKYLM